MSVIRMFRMAIVSLLSCPPALQSVYWWKARLSSSVVGSRSVKAFQTVTTGFNTGPCVFSPLAWQGDGSGSARGRGHQPGARRGRCDRWREGKGRGEQRCEDVTAHHTPAGPVSGAGVTYTSRRYYCNHHTTIPLPLPASPPPHHCCHHYGH